jgi:hypothetical protein
LRGIKLDVDRPGMPFWDIAGGVVKRTGNCGLVLVKKMLRWKNSEPISRSMVNETNCLSLEG